jgi:hypothetical protein
MVVRQTWQKKRITIDNILNLLFCFTDLLLSISLLNHAKADHICFCNKPEHQAPFGPC